MTRLTDTSYITRLNTSHDLIRHNTHSSTTCPTWPSFTCHHLPHSHDPHSHVTTCLIHMSQPDNLRCLASCVRSYKLHTPDAWQPAWYQPSATCILHVAHAKIHLAHAWFLTRCTSTASLKAGVRQRASTKGVGKQGGSIWGGGR